MHLKIFNSLYTKTTRYDFAVESAYDFILEQEINALPVDPFKICKSNNWKLEKASEIAYDLNCSVEYLLEKKLRTKDGIVIYSPTTDEYSIIYNDTMRNQDRIRWTIAHEIGHIVLNHLSSSQTSLLRNELSDSKYSSYEKEADCFAGILMAPPIILNRLNLDKYYQIQQVCKLSYHASISRCDYIKKFYSFERFNDYSECILSQFKKFINKKYCTHCGYVSYIEKSKYCPICGGYNLLWEYHKKGENNMKYDSIILNDKNKSEICPVCGNEETNIDGGYCQICGTHILNECTNYSCSANLDGNSRFCPYCGAESSFLRDNLLKSWKNVKSEFEFLDGLSTEDNPKLDLTEMPF